MQTAQERSIASQKVLLERFEDRDCEFCEEGIFVAGSFKGNDAVVCDVCGAPIVQLWLDQ